MRNQLKMLLLMKMWVGNLSKEFPIGTRESASKQAVRRRHKGDQIALQGAVAFDPETD